MRVRQLAAGARRERPDLVALLVRKRRRPRLPLRLQLRRRRLLQRLVLLLLQGRGGAAWPGRAPLRRASSLRQRLHRCHLCPAGMQCQFRVPQRFTVRFQPRAPVAVHRTGVSKLWRHCHRTCV